MPPGERAVWVPVNLGIIVGVKVDKARSDDQAISIERLLGITRIELTDFCDLAILNANVGHISWGPAAINDGSATDEHIKIRHTVALLLWGERSFRIHPTMPQKWNTCQ